MEAHETGLVTPCGVPGDCLSRWVGWEQQAVTSATALTRVASQVAVLPSTRDCIAGGIYVSQEPDAAARSLAQKIDYLFRTVHPSGRGEYSNAEVAAALQAAGGPTISATYVWQLRTGKRDNPTMKHLEALASFFQVPPAYFFDDEASSRITEELATLAALRDAGVRSIALRANGLSPQVLSSIRGMLDHARALEGLPASEDPPTPS